MNSCVVLSFCLVFGLAGTQAKDICYNISGGCPIRGQVRCFINGYEYCMCPKGTYTGMGNMCHYPHPPRPPKTPTEEEKQNSVLLEILNANKSEWHVIVNRRFRIYIRRLTHEYCMNNQGRCGLPHDLERRMNKYFNGTYLFRQAYRLPGYPKQKGQDFLFAFYVLNPLVSGAAKVIPAPVVVEILNRTVITEWIKGFLGEETELGQIETLAQYAHASPKSASRKITSKTGSWQWPAIGVAISVLALLIVLVFALRIRKRKRACVNITDPNEICHDDKQVVIANPL